MVLEALSENTSASETDLVIFSDGPRDERDVALVTAVRETAHRATGFASVRLVERESNLGLAGSVIDGVTTLLGESERIIVLEDDMLTSRHFLSYMNEGLEMYKNDSSVASVHGYCPLMRQEGPETFFLRGADCWGWATWRRAWEDFNQDGEDLLRRLKDERLTWAFDLCGAYGYTSMLKDQVAKKNDSWAVRWHASMFLSSRFTLHPGRSLVENIGADGSGTHVRTRTTARRDVSRQRITVERLEIVEDPLIRSWYADGVAMQSSRKRRFYRRLRGLLQ